MEPFPCCRQWRCTDSTWMCTAGVSGTCWVIASWRKEITEKASKAAMSQNSYESQQIFLNDQLAWRRNIWSSLQFLCLHTCESLSLPQPEPMMKATSCPSSNQPSDSSGHWPRKLSTSSRVSGHSPDTETNAEGVKRSSWYSGVVSWESRWWWSEKEICSSQLKTGTYTMFNIQIIFKRFIASPMTE